MLSRSNPVRFTVCAIALAAWAGAAGAAELPDPVKKLTGSAEDAARSVMTQQGFVQRNEKSSWGRKSTYWWSDKSRQCARLVSMAGRILQVESKGESDCKPGAVAAAGAVAASAPFDHLALAGQPRAAADQRLVRAGFKALETDMSKGDTTYITWTDGRQCLGTTIVNERYERVDELPRQSCYLK